MKWLYFPLFRRRAQRTPWQRLLVSKPGAAASCALMAALLASGAPNPQLNEIHTVYLLPMSGNLDQYLAVTLNGSNLFLIVTDPKKADAIFTERIGVNFEEALKELYPDPKEGKDKDKKEDEYSRPTMKPLSNGKGSLFLVDRKTRNVLWSNYDRPKSNRPDDINQLAQKITNKLVKDVKGK
jgi:hypothetical protein